MFADMQAAFDKLKKEEVRRMLKDMEVDEQFTTKIEEIYEENVGIK